MGDGEDSRGKDEGGVGGAEHLAEVEMGMGAESFSSTAYCENCVVHVQRYSIHFPDLIPFPETVTCSYFSSLGSLQLSYCMSTYVMSMYVIEVLCIELLSISCVRF